jgi:hypothetical protein
MSAPEAMSAWHASYEEHFSPPRVTSLNAAAIAAESVDPATSAANTVAMKQS